MAEFRVDPKELEILSARVDALRADLVSSDGSSARADIGAPRISAALEGFESNWSDGMAIIRNELEECALRLRAAATEYEGAEACVEDAVTPSGGAKQ